MTRTTDPFAAAGWTVRRLGVVMAPDPDDPREAGGVCNPACARGPDGELYLFPRLVAEGNYSRVGLARVRFDDGQTPTAVERLGVVLEPEETWEINTTTAGVEDPRITFIPSLDLYVMTYAAFGPLQSRIGLAVSNDLASWERLGPAWFAYEPSLRADLNLYTNKDALLFPDPVAAPDGRPAYALLHRPTWDLSWVSPTAGEPLPAGVQDPRPGIWVSFAPVDEVSRDLRALARFAQHRPVALPEQPWEQLKIGAGTPPIRTPEGWLILHHGVSGKLEPGVWHQRHVRYAAGAMLLDPEDVTKVVWRTSSPLLDPQTPQERDGIVPNVVFPTAIDPRGDGDADVFYGMADTRIGVARLHQTG
jgi:beta-1,2-mannobiose phosphorylase / 1,2-beta-oligomannan phosphorylase